MIILLVEKENINLKFNIKNMKKSLLKYFDIN